MSCSFILHKCIDLRIVFLQLTVEAYDTAFPSQRAREDVYIDVNRNPRAPVFQNNFLTRTIGENVALGTFIVCVTASDADNDVISYEIVGIPNPGNSNQIATDFFFMTVGGCVYVKRNLYESIMNTYSFTVRARDNAYPEKFATTTVQVVIKRDNSAPVFDSPNYQVTIQETSSVNSTLPIFTVRATDGDLQVSIIGSIFKLFSVTMDTILISLPLWSHNMAPNIVHVEMTVIIQFIHNNLKENELAEFLFFLKKAYLIRLISFLPDA